MICLKLLINFTEPITRLPSKFESRISFLNFLGRLLLVRILDTLEKRFVALRMSMNSVVQHVKSSQSNPKSMMDGQQSLTNLLDENTSPISSYMDIGFVQPIKTSARFLDGSIDVLKG